MASVEGGDRWDIKEMKSTEKAWSEKNNSERAMTVMTGVSKVLALIGLVYMFILSLNLMGNAFKVLGGKTAGATFRNNEIFNNPVAGLSMGVLATVLVQSSSTSTSIIITMSAAGLLSVKDAIPMIMGANIGTSVTNTIVSLTHMGSKDEYRRAFAGATVHDCFNFLTVGILLPVEAATELLLVLSDAFVDAVIPEDQEKRGKVDFLKKLTKPIASRLVQVDKKLVTKVAEAPDQATLDELMDMSILVQKRTKSTHMFMDTPLSDDAAGWLLLIVSLVFLTTCLGLMVKLLQSVFRGRAAIWMQSLLNLNFKSIPWLGDYVLLVFGIGITILMQSSSITTSTLTPLVGVGLIKLEKMFPFTVGANIGTCVTGILAALASSNINLGMKVAMAHLFFNLIGTLMWFPIPMCRKVPLGMAKVLGSLAGDLTWFPWAYTTVVFGVLPVAFLLLCIAGPAVFGVFGSLLMLFILSTLAVLTLRLKKPEWLPEALKADPSWMPNTLRVQHTADAAGNQGPNDNSCDADLGAQKKWQQAPMTWGLAWFGILMLIMAIPNAQWSNFKYAKFDEREHVGLGAWSACSAQYTEAMDWTAAPSGCNSQTVQQCWDWHMASCGSSGFANAYGANEHYEESWNNCTAHFQCTASQWQEVCLAASCGGSGHADQCRNLTKAVTPNFTPKYTDLKTGQAWAAGDRCRPLEEVCDNSGSISASGYLASLGLSLALLAQFLLLSHGFVSETWNKPRIIASSVGVFAVSWFFLLLSWAIYAGALDGEATCTIVDATTRKAIEVTAPFKDIVDGGGLGFGFVTVSWFLVFAVVLLSGWRASKENKLIGGEEEVEVDATVAVKEEKAQVGDTEQNPVDQATGNTTAVVV